MSNQLQWADGVVQENNIVITSAGARYRLANRPNYFPIGGHVIFKPPAESPQHYREEALDSVKVELGKTATFALNARIFNALALVAFFVTALGVICGAYLVFRGM